MIPQFRVPPIRPDLVAVAGGMDVVTSPLFVKPGTPRLAYNHEAGINGGLTRAGGFEPFDGRTAPSSATYVLLECEDGIIGAAVGNTLTGATSAATGKVIYVTSTLIAVTQVSGTFQNGEDLEVSSVVVGVVSSLTPSVDGFLDNTLLKAAADVYQALIGQVPGSGPVRGLAVHDDAVYAWRNNTGGTALAIYKSSISGWTLVPLYHEVSFTSGTGQYDDGDTLTQGGVSATIKRVVLESGAWGSTAAGRFIITTPSGGSFANGAASGGGACTLSGASTQIALSPGGRVRTVRNNFGGSANATRLYGCDGVNREFELGDDVLAPLTTGMGTVRASCVAAHKNHLFFAYQSSLQHSSIGDPYQWSPVTGASELALGDTITNLVSIGGNETSAAMMVTGQDSIHVLYGNDSTDWDLKNQSRVSGAQARSAQDIGGVVAMDKPGVVRYPVTQAFGNFLWDRVSLAVDPLAAGKECECSVFVASQARYRVFYTDGTALSGFSRTKIMPTGGTQQSFDWTVLSYGKTIKCAEHGEIDGVARTFYADDQGWVYEADKGRSFAGEPITYAVVFHPLNQKSGLTEKTYKGMQLEVTADSACTLYTSGEFTEAGDPSQQQTMPLYGAGLRWDLSQWGKSYWGVPNTSRTMTPLEGYGTAVEISVAGESDSELPHTLTALTVLFIPRRMTR